MKKIYVLGGGTFNHVRSHLSLAAPAFGETAIELAAQLYRVILEQNRRRPQHFIALLECALLGLALILSAGYAEQWPNECGSHECGKNTSDHLETVDLCDGHQLKAVYLDSHGPNVVFSRSVPPEKVIAYIDRTFDLDRKTGGAVA